MHLNRWAAWLSLALLLFIGGLACETTDRVLSVAQAKTEAPTRTRTPRPTFTAVPSATATSIPTDTPLPIPTRTATRRPLTPKPPTPKPPPTAPPAPAASPQPTTPTWQFSVAGVSCEHAGQYYIKGSVYADKNDPGSGMPGVLVAIGGSGGDQFQPANTTDGNGDYTYILSLPPDPGSQDGKTYYVWVVDSSGKRLSPIGGPIAMNKKPDNGDGTSCWAGHVFFTKNF